MAMVIPQEQVLLDQVLQWQDELTALQDRIAPHIRRPEVRARAGRLLAGLLEPVERRKGWHLAEALGERSPDGVQVRADVDALPPLTRDGGQ